MAGGEKVSLLTADGRSQPLNFLHRWRLRSWLRQCRKIQRCNVGGITGDNSDSHWTDNITGTADDRWINTDKKPGTQAMFVMAQALTSEVFLDADANYRSRCMNAATRSRSVSNGTGPNTLDLVWWVSAAAEMYHITGGIMNGICGDDQDRPILDSQTASDWHTKEYWSPHVVYCRWIPSSLAGGTV